MLKDSKVKSRSAYLKNILIYPEKCSGCKDCMRACNFTTHGSIAPEMSRIRVIKFDGGLSVPMICFQCEPAPCMSVCPTKALSRHRETYAVVLDYGKCIGCKLCLVACPFGAIHHDLGKRMVYKCDLCYGDPLCVKWCNEDAILFGQPEEMPQSKLRMKAEEMVRIISG